MSLFVKCFPWNALVRTTASFTDDEGEPVDPDDVTLSTFDPIETQTDYEYGVDAIERDSIGEYHFDILASIAGNWSYRWAGTGAAAAVAEGQFKVAASVFEPGSP